MLNYFSIGDLLETTKLPNKFVNKVHEELNLDNKRSKFSFFEQKILSSTIEMSEIDLSDNEKGKRTDPQLQKATPSSDYLFSL